MIMGRRRLMFSNPFFGVRGSFLDFITLNDAAADKDRVEVLQRSLPEAFCFIALITDAKNMDYDSILYLLESEVERKRAHSKHIN